MRNTAGSLVKRQSTAVLLSLILVASVVLRLGSALYLGNSVDILPGTYDQVSYHALALRVLDGYGFSFGTPSWPLTAAGAPTAHWSFLYTLYLSAVYAIFGPNPLAARLIQAVIVGLLQPYLVYLLGSRIFNQRTGLLAAAFTAVYIYFIYYSATLMTEPFYITSILAALYLTLRLAQAQSRDQLWLAVILGVVLGVTVLLRQLFLLFVPVLLAWLWAARYVISRRSTAATGDEAKGIGLKRFFESGLAPLLPTAMIVGLIVLLILPFTLYNFSRFDRFVLLNTNAGFAFFWANHPIYGTRFEGILPPEMGSYQDLIPVELRNLDEPALEQALMERGVEFVLDDPGRYILLSLSRIPVYFKFWPSSDSGMISNVSRVASFALFLPLMLGGLIYSLVDREMRQRTLGQASLLLLFMVVYVGIHLASWALIRYRLPVDAILLIYAGLAADAGWRWVRSRLDATVSPGPAQDIAPTYDHALE